MSDLLINGKDTAQNWGVYMGDGFIDAIETPAPLKDFLSFSSRVLDGQTIDTDNVKVDARDVTLKFRIFGSETIPDEFSTLSTYDNGVFCTHNGIIYVCINAISEAGTWDASRWKQLNFIQYRQLSLQQRKKEFLAELSKANVTIQIPMLNSDVYHLVYTGKNITFAMSTDRTNCIIGAKFIEPNPTNRQ